MPYKKPIKARAIAMWQKGKTFTEIAERLGCSRSTARRWVFGIEQPKLYPETYREAGPEFIPVEEIWPELKATVTSVAGRPQPIKRGLWARFRAWVDRINGLYGPGTDEIEHYS